MFMSMPTDPGKRSQSWGCGQIRNSYTMGISADQNGCRLNSKAVVCSSVVLGLLLLLFSSMVSAARCQIKGVSFSYPNQALPSQQIQVDTFVAGSCASSGQDYYSVRVDLVDISSSYIVSSSSTPIGHTASDFNVTAVNTVTTPSSNMTWPLQIHVYVIRAGGTNGVYLLDYQTVSNATIQVSATALPEFHYNPASIIIITACAIGVIRYRRRSREI